MAKIKKENQELDYAKLNEGIKIGVDILKIFLVLVIIASVFLCTKILIDWKVFPFIRRFLRIISPLFIGIIIAWLFDPLVTKLQKKGVNRVLGSIFVYVVLIFAVYMLCLLMVPSISNEIEDLGKTVPNIINYLKDGLDSFFDGFGDTTEVSNVKTAIYDAINDFSDSVTVDMPSKVVGIASSIVSGSINFIFGLFIGLYMLFDFDGVKKLIRSLIPKKHKEDVTKLLGTLNRNLKNYVQGTFLIMGLLFIIQSIGLALAGVKAPMVFGLFCAITDIIPFVGPYIGGIPAVLVGFSMSPTTGIFALIAVVICQCIENYFLQPVVMGKTMRLHPVTIIVGLLIFNHFFGVLGMVLATPTIAICKTIFNFFNEKYGFMEKLKDY